MDLARLETGYRFQAYSFTISADAAAEYAAAVGDSTFVPAPAGGETIPPMAVIACGLARMIEELGLGGGTIHARQEVELDRAARPGERIIASPVLTGNTVRRSSRFATVHTAFSDAAGKRIATSTSTVIVPA